MKYFNTTKHISEAFPTKGSLANKKNRLTSLIRFLLFLFIIQYSSFNTANAQCAGGTPSVMAKWTFESLDEQCNGATPLVPSAYDPTTGGYNSQPRTYPTLGYNSYSFCPDLNAGCAQTLLGSKGFQNTDNFANALCLSGFADPYNSTQVAPGWVPSDPTFHPEIPANISVWYTLPAGVAGSLSGFSLFVNTQHMIAYKKQGVGVYRNGILIYSTTQPITTIWGQTMTFNFPSSSEFYSNGASTVQFEIVFGLVERVQPLGYSYDDITVWGTCGASPMPVASISPATCSGSGSNTDGKISLSNFGATDHFDYNVGATYTGGKTYASAAAIPVGGIITSALPNPASPTVYTVRVFTAAGCTQDLQVTLNPTYCPVACTPPTATATPSDATCAGTTANSDAKITISGFGATDTYQYSTGATFTAASATPATATVIPAGGVIASTLANPAAVQTYTVRIYGAGSSSCYVDRVVSINPKSCTVACTTPTATATGTGATCTGNSPNKDAKITLAGFGATDTYQYSVGSSFSAGTATPVSATVIPASGIIANTLANPTSPITYTVRIYAAGASTCYADRTVTISPTICTVPCTPPTATVTATSATCTGTGMNAQIAISGITSGDKVGLSAGSAYAGVTYSTAQAAASSYTFSNLPNPQGSQVYTVRVFNGGDNCFKDYPVTITETTCGACKKYGIEIVCSDQADANSTVNNSISTEDDFTTYEICKDTKKIDLKLTKTVSPNTGTTCPTNTDFVWTVTLTNTGDMTATDIQVADIIPNGLVVTNITPSAGTFSNAGWLIPSLAGSGATATLSITTKATIASTYTNCAEIVGAFPLNDPNSTPGNGVTTEDDYACASITVTGPKTPFIKKEFSPAHTQANVPTRLTIKITNNETTPITTTAALVDNLPSTPAQMVIATTPNLTTSLTGVVATAGGTSITIPSGTVLLPGLNQVQVDITVPAEGNYCNSIAAGSLKTTSCDNIVGADACLDVLNTNILAPVMSKTMLPATIQAGSSSILTITVENRNATDLILTENFKDFSPTGLIFNGSVSGTCSGVSTFSSTNTVGLTSGSTIAANSKCTIVVPVTSSTAGTYCNRFGANALIGTVSGIRVSNQDHVEACINVVTTPCTAIDLTSITPNPTGTITTGATVNLTAVGTGTGASTVYTWANSGTGTFSSQVVSPTYTAPATAGTYTISVTANNNLTGYGTCTASATTTISVIVPAGPCTPLSALVASATPNSLTTGNASALNVTGTGIMAGSTYSWTGTAGFTSAIQAPSTGTIAAAGGYSYSVTVTNTNGTGVCTASATTSLTVALACTPPSGILAGISQVTCTNGVANANGKITLSGFSTEKYDLFAGDPYAGTATFATATTIPAGGVIASNLANPAVSQVYTIRVFNGNNCYTDVKVTLNNKNCTCPVMCEPVTTRKTKG